MLILRKVVIAFFDLRFLEMANLIHVFFGEDLRRILKIPVGPKDIFK